VFIARAMCSCLVLQLQSVVYIERCPAALAVAGRSMSMLISRPTITRVELSTVHLYQHYSLFMHNKLRYIWRGDYCKCVWPAQLPVLTWGSSPVTPGTFTTRSPPGPRRIQHSWHPPECFIWMHKNSMKLHVQVFLKINNWLFETCRRQCKLN